VAYVAPQLTLIGHASGVVLGFSGPVTIDNPNVTLHHDSTAELEAEW